ncbi:MAG: histidine kinase, partial [Bacteroidota bacterium]
YNHHQDLPDSKLISLTVGNSQNIYLGYKNNELCVLNTETNTANPILTGQTESFYPDPIFYDRKTDILYVYQYFVNGHKLEFSNFVNPITGNNLIIGGSTLNYITQYKKDTLLIGNTGGPAMLNTKEMAMIPQTIYSLNHPNQPTRTFCYNIHPDGTHLVGGLNGLFIYEDFDTLIPTNLGFSELDTRIEDIEILPDSSIVFGTRGRGVIRYFGDSIWVIDKEAGLASDLVRDIHQMDDGTIWVSTFSGATRIAFFKDESASTLSVNSSRPYHIKTYTTAHGLPSNEVHQIESIDRQIWMATSDGLVKFESPNKVLTSRPPSIRSFRVNGELQSLNSRLVLGPNQNNLELAYSTINFCMQGRIPYRYRLQTDDSWSYTQNLSLTYPNLVAGEYQFEVQSQNEDGIWSESAVFHFQIRPFWYERNGIQLLSVLLLMGGIILYFRKSFAQRERALALQNQMQELERSALSAQMNPHFIFNCLNSINNFILDNDATQASLYLSRFAKLIRKTLNVSVAGTHTLEDEINMLESYLELEKLRFKHQIEYRIQVDPSLDTLDTKLPPLLIQPFVENALVHGLSNRPETGMIHIEFSSYAYEQNRDQTTLLVVVEDNGHGIKQKTKRWEKDHRMVCG